MKSGKWQMTEEIELPNRKNQNVRRKGNLQILGNIGNGYNQTSAGERKNIKRVPRENENYSKTTETVQGPTKQKQIETKRIGRKVWIFQATKSKISHAKTWT